MSMPEQLESDLGKRLDDHDLLLLVYGELKHYQEDSKAIQQILKEQGKALQDLRDWKFKVVGAIAAIVALFEGAMHYLLHK